MSNLSAQDYLNQKVKVLFEPIISKILEDKPSEPVHLSNLASISNIFARKIFRQEYSS